MIVFPKEFVKTRRPGYFWHIDEQKLYSIKINGVLKPMKFQKAYHGYVNGQRLDIEEGYRISHNGHRETMTLDYLKTLKPVSMEIVDVKEAV